MAKLVGLSRNLKLPWLNQVVTFLSEDLSEADVKAKLNEYLGFEIGSPTNLRKTREILMNIWYYKNEYTEKLRPTALALIKKHPDYAMAIHWCMLLATYPIFQDMCRLIAKTAEFQDEIILAQLKQKIYDEWGERTTLYHSIDKLIATLKALDVLDCEMPGRYRIKKHQIDKDDVASFLIYVLMVVDNSAYYSMQDINSSVYLFPFEYQVRKELLLQDERFEMSNFGGELSIGLAEGRVQ